MKMVLGLFVSVSAFPLNPQFTLVDAFPLTAFSPACADTRPRAAPSSRPAARLAALSGDEDGVVDAVVDGRATASPASDDRENTTVFFP